ncbi:hypothetical protein [Azospirillum sp. A23]|uniref:hypothetical protein n=1 Tax=Azospirillum sp. A23 TaxID=3160608 RepID=UPI0036F233B3
MTYSSLTIPPFSEESAFRFFQRMRSAMEKIIYLIRITEEEIESKKYVPINLKDCDEDLLIKYHEGTAQADLLARRGYIFEHNSIRISNALIAIQRETKRRFRRFLRFSTFGGSGSDCAELTLDIQKVQEVSLTRAPPTPRKSDAQTEPLRSVTRDHGPVQPPTAEITRTAKPVAPPPAAPPPAHSPLPVLTLEADDHGGLERLREHLLTVTNEDIRRQELTQVAEIKRIWGDRLLLAGERLTAEQMVVRALATVRQEMAERGMIDAGKQSLGQKEEALFRQTIQRRQQANRNRNRGYEM